MQCLYYKAIIELARLNLPRFPPKVSPRLPPRFSYSFLLHGLLDSPQIFSPGSPPDSLPSIHHRTIVALPRWRGDNIIIAMQLTLFYCVD